ncbi:Uncharacterised protein [uncultured archaeon]|nr:Uncharacterised protein [uncultured archaeon]
MFDVTGIKEAVLRGDYSQLFFLFIGLFFFILTLAVAVYVYTSLAMMAIAKKAKHRHPGLVWIPVVGQYLVTSQIAKMPWWPILLLFGIFIPFIGGLSAIVLCVFSTIWMWKTFEAVKKPGWWALLNFIPLIGTLVFLVLLGIAAWGKK